jgi:hypothetical protein
MFLSSAILSLTENSYLTNMTRPIRQPTLLYKLTRDGYGLSTFHSKCDGKSNTVTIIKTNSNYVFGAYTAAMWKSDGTYTYGYDTTAFIFSLRRNGISYNEKYMVRDPSFAIGNYDNWGPTFGEADSDIYLTLRDGGYIGHTNFGNSYSLPAGYSYGQEKTKSYLAGSYSGWIVSEVEVFQL